MLLELLKRDLRLHYGALLLPFVFALTMAGLYPFNPDLPIFGPVLGFVFAAFLPLALHLREQSTGSLGDLASLPVSRTRIVQLRFLEAFLLPSVLLVLANLATALITHTWPHLPDANLMRGLGWALFYCFAFLLPFTLRWDGKGLVVAYGILFALGLGLNLTQYLPQPIHLSLWAAFMRIVMFIAAHPHLHTLLLLGLFALCYQAAIRAFAARDL